MSRLPEPAGSALAAWEMPPGLASDHTLFAPGGAHPAAVPAGHEELDNGDADRKYGPEEAGALLAQELEEARVPTAERFSSPAAMMSIDQQLMEAFQQMKGSWGEREGNGPLHSLLCCIG